MLENRKILTALIGYIIGIIMGLYCKISIVFFYIPFFTIIHITLKNNFKNQFKLVSFRRYSRYLKIIFNKKVIKIIIFFSIISNSIVLYQNYKYQELYKDLNDKKIEITGIVTNVSTSKYKVKVKSNKYKNTYIILYLGDNKTTKLEYGDKINIQGIFSIPQGRTNYKGFDYKEYLKTLKIYGIVKAKNVTIKSKNNINYLLELSNNINLKMQKRIEESNFSKNEKALIKAIILGNKEELEDDVIETFSKSNISHMLAISGMHISYIILLSSFIFNKLIGKHYSNILTVFVISIYICITNFSISVIRAGISGILLIMSKILYRKNDIFQSIAISLFLILIYNPFLINNISLILSFAGTIGIIVFRPIIKMTVSRYLEIIGKRAVRKNRIIIKAIIKILNTRIIQNIIDICIVNFSATITIIPIILTSFNRINITNIIISIITSLIIGPIIILGIIFIITKIQTPLKIFIKILVYLSELGSKIPLNQIYFITPNIVQIIIYYILIFSIFFLIKIYIEKKSNAFRQRIKNLISLTKYKIKQYKNKISLIILIIILINFFINITPKNLKIYFLDVGQRRLYTCSKPSKKDNINRWRWRRK